MNILFLTQWFQPEPFFKGLPFAKALKAAGHDVEVLTGFPNYPGGNLYSGYRLRLCQREMMDGIRVNRAVLYPSHNSSGLKRMLNYLSFGGSALALGPFLVKKPDVIYVYNLVTLGPLAYLLRFIYGCPVVYDIQDLWPDSVASSGMMQSRNLLEILDRVCKWIYNRSNHLLALSSGMKKELILRGAKQENVSVIYNWCDEKNMRHDDYDKSFSSHFGLSDSFVIMFAGTMGIGQALECILEVAEKIFKIEQRIKFVFVGGGIEKDRLKNIAQERKLANVKFIDQQPPEAMPKILALADLMLVHIKDLPAYRIVIPSKIQAYMAAGKPILCAACGDAAKTVKDARAGVIANPEDVRSITDAVLHAYWAGPEKLKVMGDNARNYYLSVLSMETGLNLFTQLFQTIKGNFSKSSGNPQNFRDKTS